MKKISKRTWKWVSLCGLATVCLSNGAYATIKITKAGPAPDFQSDITEQAYKKELKDAEDRGRRSVASADAITEAALSDSFNNFRSEIIGGDIYKDGKVTDKDGKPFAPKLEGIKNTEQLYQLLLKLSKDDVYYNTLEPDAKFIAAQMAPLIVFNGFFNRVMNLIPKAPLAHMAIVTALRTFGSGTMVYFPTDQWAVGLEFLTKPNKYTEPAIVSDLELHTFMEKELVPAITKMRKRIFDLRFEKPIYIDNKIFYGTANFASDQDRFARVGEAERLTFLAGTDFTLSGICSLNAYNLHGIFEAIDKIGTDYGFRTITSRVTGTFDPTAATAQQRFTNLREMEDTGLFKLRDGGNTWMVSSYNSLKNAVRNSEFAWKEINARANDTASHGNLIDPRAFVPYSRGINATLSNMRLIVTGGESKLQSAITSDGRRITLSQFYGVGPDGKASRDPKIQPPSSLYKLFPTHFDQTPYNQSVVINGQKKVWHNFLNGRPTDWDVAEYQKLFPEIQNKEDVRASARVTAQAWGGWMLGIPLSSLVL